MGFEVDCFALRGGAATTLRWSHGSRFKTLVYDEGINDTGAAFVEHLRQSYGATAVDYLVCGKLTTRNVEGLAFLLKAIGVGELWMHLPRKVESGAGRARHEAANRLVRLAASRCIPVREPFRGSVLGPCTVLSPDRHWYRSILAPALEASAIGEPHRFMQTLARGWRSHLAFAASACGLEHLPGRPASTALHDTSPVLYAEFEGRGVLLTGSAGMQALGHACDTAEALNIDLPANLSLMMLPDHGNCDHLSSQLLDRILGPASHSAQRRREKSAFVISDREQATASIRALASALRRRGATTFVTRGTHLHHGHDMPERRWRPARPLRIP